MDPVKAAIAGKVQTVLVDDINFRFPDLPIESIEFSRVDDLNTQVRVVTIGHGVRYFSVKVSEHF